MDDVVAVKVELADGTSRYFLTFGRIQDVVEPGPLCELVLSHAAPYVLGTNVVGASICSRMREAAVSNEAPYFYENLLGLARELIPFGADYEVWRLRIATEMEEGRHLYFCGNPA